MRALVCVLFVAACSHESVEPAAGSPPSIATPSITPRAPRFREQPALIVATTPAELDAGVSTFSLLSTRDLLVRVDLPALPSGITFVTIDLVGHDGSAFYATRVPFSTDSAVTEVDEEGAPHPIDVEHPTGTLPLHLDVTVPVAGTDLVRKAMPGPWQIDAVVEGTDTHLTKILTATMTP